MKALPILLIAIGGYYIYTTYQNEPTNIINTTTQVQNKEFEIIQDNSTKTKVIPANSLYPEHTHKNMKPAPDRAPGPDWKKSAKW